MKNKFIPLIIFFLVLLNSTVNAQFYDNFEKIIDGYKFSTVFDSVNFETKLSIEYNGKKIFQQTYVDLIDDIKKEYINDNYYIFIDLFSGGAHCCFWQLIGKFDSDKFLISDTAFYGNSGYAFEDMNHDGKKEIMSGNDMFAYAFTNYAETRFPLRVQTIEEGKLIDITSDFDKILEDEIYAFKKDLDELIKEGIACPDDENEETFNTSAGSAKTILAAIVADYYSLGKVRRGYDLIDKVYKCPDKDKFKNILKKDFKLY